MIRLLSEISKPKHQTSKQIQIPNPQTTKTLNDFGFGDLKFEVLIHQWTSAQFFPEWMETLRGTESSITVSISF
jgi:hypothetical protein